MPVRIEVETKMGECLFAIPERVDMQMYFAVVRDFILKTGISYHIGVLVCLHSS
jgi:hypothetical protein